MNKNVLGTLGAGIVLALWAASVASAPAMWKATDEDSTVWLFGSMHLLPEDTDWRSPALKHALKSADLFYYEVPLDSKGRMKMALLLGRYGLNRHGKQLTDYLNEKQTELLKAVASNMGLPMARLQFMKPWLANLTLQLLFAKQAGYRAEQGVERSLMPRTPDDQERYFETIHEQISFLTELSQEAAVGALVATLHQIREQPALLDKMVAAWQAGNVETLSALLHEAMKEAGRAVYQTLIIDRNKAWLEEILTRMEGDKDILVVVGAGHLVGEDGLPAMLEAAGVTVERIQ